MLIAVMVFGMSKSVFYEFSYLRKIFLMLLPDCHVHAWFNLIAFLPEKSRRSLRRRRCCGYNPERKMRRMAEGAT